MEILSHLIVKVFHFLQFYSIDVFEIAHQPSILFEFSLSEFQRLEEFSDFHRPRIALVFVGMNLPSFIMWSISIRFFNFSSWVQLFNFDALTSKLGCATFTAMPNLSISNNTELYHFSGMAWAVHFSGIYSRTRIEECCQALLLPSQYRGQSGSIKLVWRQIIRRFTILSIGFIGDNWWPRWNVFVLYASSWCNLLGWSHPVDCDQFVPAQH